MSDKKEIYLSLDVETDGPCAGINNMLTIGVAAFDIEGRQLDTFYGRILPLPDLKPHPKTMAWWHAQPKYAFDEAFGTGIHSFAPGSSRPAYDVMISFGAWLQKLRSIVSYDRLVPIAWPAAFDFAFINYYSHRFLSDNPLGYACLDIRSHIMGLMRKRGYYDMKESEVNNIFGEIDKAGLRDHIAIDDAIAQGRLFFHIRDHEILK
jgi:hypothetical protein